MSLKKKTEGDSTFNHRTNGIPGQLSKGDYGRTPPSWPCASWWKNNINNYYIVEKTVH